MALTFAPLLAALADTAQTQSAQTAPATAADAATPGGGAMAMLGLLIGGACLAGVIWLLRKIRVPADAPMIGPARPYLYNVVLRRPQNPEDAPLVPEADNPEHMAQWGILEFALAFAAQFFIVGQLARMMYPGVDLSTLDRLDRYQVQTALCVVVTTGLLLFTYALHQQNPLRYFFPGVAWRGLWWKLPAIVVLGWTAVGLFASPVWAMLLQGLGVERELQSEVTGLIESAETMTAGGIAITIVAIAIVTPIFEEVLFRGFLYIGLRKLIGPLPAAFVSGLVFAVVHFNLYAAGPLFALGVLLAVSYERTRSLATPIIFHAVFNLITLLLIWNQLLVD